MKVITILGTRPEIIRLSRIIPALDRVFDHVLVHTGQNSDYTLSEIFFQDLEVRKPDYFLGISHSSHGRIIGEILIETEKILVQEKPDALLVLGDTNSALSVIIARHMKIPVFHLEAGNRCFDGDVPEEVNRRIVDHTSDINLVYTEHARRNLLGEGIHPRMIYLTGSPMREVLDHNRSKLSDSQILQKLKLDRQGYFVCSLHRAENVDRERNLAQLFAALEQLYSEHGLPIIVSTHPRTRDRLEDTKDLRISGDIRLMEPFGYHDYINLQLNAACTLSDSGTISEEAAILGFPAVTLRNSIERPEAMDTGHIVVTGLGTQAVLDAVELVMRDRQSVGSWRIPPEYDVENTSDRVVRILLGTAKLCQGWQGMEPK